MLRRLWEYVRDAAGCRWRRGGWCCSCSQGVARSNWTTSTGRGGNVRAREGAVGRDREVSAFSRVRDGCSPSPLLFVLPHHDAETCDQRNEQPARQSAPPVQVLDVAPAQRRNVVRTLCTAPSKSSSTQSRCQFDSPCTVYVARNRLADDVETNGKRRGRQRH